MSTILDLQIASENAVIPQQQDMQLWLDTLMTYQRLTKKEITVRIVDEAEIQQLNQQYRNKDQTTNVLSFPFEVPQYTLPDGAELDNSMTNFLGDIVICAQVVEQESKQQNKQIEHHWAHMLIHGTLHLCGYDHIEQQEAQEMESIEIAVLQKLAIDDPYQNH
ncbi:rRNA maturation RNase YbeY [uncultured Paraglaciecola sp.]|uniref:rRNA maturation RNase YbeY n=1 Tax=uncultured Paraglaciecola sp. TaxID=1765024 RepID=UPI00262E9730|nr:rRNA maturation RNase YbeY [uncultured Paraglaciecola sp.]